jgi:hypothetical protein
MLLSSNHPKIITVVIALAFASQINAAVPGCRFYESTENFMYTCEYIGGIIRNDTDVLDFSGEHLPNRTNLDVRRIEFYKCLMDTMPANLFDTFPNLEVVLAEGVGMKWLEVGTLNNCDHLRELILIQNLFERLENGIFANCKNILRLDFTWNFIRTIGEVIFADTPHLKSINLHDNALQELPERVFQNAGSLRHIDLSLNKIKRISPNLFQGNPDLVTIDLNFNKISRIPDYAFFDLRLASLNLSINAISDIGRGAFGRVGSTNSKSGILDLSSNQIARLSSDIFDGFYSDVISLNIENTFIYAVERNFFDFFPVQLTVFTAWNICVKGDAVFNNRSSINEAFEQCFEAFDKVN